MSGEGGGRSRPTYEVTHLDVGNSNASVIEYGDTTVLVDGDQAKHVDEIKDELRTEDGYDRIDAVVATHFHSDHTKGLQKLVQDRDLDVGSVFGPHPDLYDDVEYSDTFFHSAERSGVDSDDIYPIATEHEIGDSEFSLELRFPHEDYPGLDVTDGDIDGSAHRNDGLAIRSSYAGHSTLFLGDATSEELAALRTSHGDFLDADTVVAPHHGSIASSGTEYVDFDDFDDETLDDMNVTPDAGLSAVEGAIETQEDVADVAEDLQLDYLERADPDDVVVSADPDYRNYGHPSPLTLAAVEGSDVDADLHYTQVHGTIRRRVGPNQHDLTHEYELPGPAEDVVDARLRDGQLDFQQPRHRTDRAASAAEFGTSDATTSGGARTEPSTDETATSAAAFGGDEADASDPAGRDARGVDGGSGPSVN